MFVKKLKVQSKIYNIFLFILIFFPIHNCKVSFGQNAPKKMDTAFKQLSYAVDLYFNADEKERKSGYKNVIRAYQAVQEYFPNSKKTILIAKGNLAGLYKEVGQFDIARKLYEEVLKELPADSPKRYQNYKGLIFCLDKNVGSKENYHQYIFLKEKYKEAAGIFSINYSILCLSASLEKASIEDGRRLRKLTLDILKELILSETELGTKELIVIRHLLGQIQLYDIWHSIILMKKDKMETHGSIMEKKINLLVLNKSVTLTSDYKSITGEFDHKKMLELGDKDYITYMIFQKKMLEYSVITTLREDIGKKSLSVSGQRCLELIREYHFRELEPVLKKILKSLDKSGDIDQVKNILKLFNKNS